MNLGMNRSRDRPLPIAYSLRPFIVIIVSAHTNTNINMGDARVVVESRRGALYTALFITTTSATAKVRRAHTLVRVLSCTAL